MKPRLILLATVLLSLTMPLRPIAASEPGPAAGAAEPQVWLRGAFGRVLGTDPTQPAAAYPGTAPLDTFIRRAPLVLETNVPTEYIETLSVRSRSVSSGAKSEALSDGATEFEGPDVVGRTVVTATLASTSAEPTHHSWLLEVPPREGDLDTLFEIVPPGIMLSSASGRVAGVAGNGCYAYLCSDSGAAPVPRNLSPLRVAVGEALDVSSDDGSGLVGWAGRLVPDIDTPGDPLRASDHLGAPTATMSLPGLEPTAPGGWVLLLRVDFDRERGWLWHAYRLTAE